jgi:hypothetical protein
VWASTFPEGPTGVSPQADLLAGGRRRQKQEHAHLCAYGVLGLVSQIRIDRLLEAMRLDAAWLKTAATPEQHALMAGRDLRTPPGTAWAGSPEHQEQLRVERQRALERYRQEWGRDPV